MCRRWCRELLGGGALGDQVGEQVGAAVVGLLTNPVMSNGLITLVDTIAGGLFSNSDVIDAWAAAVSQLGVGVLTGQSFVIPCCQRFWRA